jgi:hypothetical protein
MSGWMFVYLLVSLAPSACHVLTQACLKLDAASVRPGVSEDVLVCRRRPCRARARSWLAVAGRHEATGC